jgi:hypothetical protein
MLGDGKSRFQPHLTKSSVNHSDCFDNLLDIMQTEPVTFQSSWRKKLLVAVIGNLALIVTINKLGQWFRRMNLKWLGGIFNPKSLNLIPHF